MREDCACALLALLLACFQHALAWTAAPLPRAPWRTPSSQSRFPISRRSHASDRRRTVLSCKLDRLPARTLKRVVPLRPTTESYLAFFGQTKSDRGRKLIKLIGGLFAFYWAAFFATRNVYVLGPGGVNAIAWRGSCLAVIVETFLRPVVGSYSRALELWGAGNKEARKKTKGALFTGRVTRTGFALSSQASNHRAHFQMLVEDESGRELLFDVPQVPEYRRIRKGMQCAVVVLSRSAGFYELTGVTEAYLPELDLFVGRFPLLDKRVFWDLLQERNGRNSRGGGSGTVTALRKQARLRSEGAGQLGSSRKRTSSRGGGDDKSGLETNNSRIEQQRQRDVRRFSRNDRDPDDGGGMIARSSRSRYHE